MTSLAVSSKPRKRVTFANDDPERLMKPKPCMVAVYHVKSKTLIAFIKTAAEIEEDELAELRSLRKSSNAWRPRRIKHKKSFMEEFLGEDDDDDLTDAVWELLQNAIKLDADHL